MKRTPKVKADKPQKFKVTSRKVHPLILDYLRSKGISVTAVEVAPEGDSVMIYNNALEESK